MDPKAQDIIDRCVGAHEQEHINRKHIVPCQPEVDFEYPGPNPNTTLDERECLAVRAELECLEQGLTECKTDDCRTEVWIELDNALFDEDYHCERWGKGIR
jgi:hypothetical protein